MSRLTDLEIQEMKDAIDHAANAPVMTLRSDLPTFAETARQALHDKAKEILLKHGFTEEDGIDTEKWECVKA